jgi:hypothetical protein
MPLAGFVTLVIRLEIFKLQIFELQIFRVADLRIGDLRVGDRRIAAGDLIRVAGALPALFARFTVGAIFEALQNAWQRAHADPAPALPRCG